jgi:hypothetical protein
MPPCGREQQKGWVLGYDRWENFSRSVDEARKAATIVDATDQFRDVAKMIEAAPFLCPGPVGLKRPVRA